MNVVSSDKSVALSTATAIGRRVADWMETSNNSTLFSGTTGAALLFDALAKCDESEDWTAMRRLAFTRLPTYGVAGESLSMGWAGVAFAARLVAADSSNYRKLIEKTSEATTNALLAICDRRTLPFATDYDLISGLAGMLVATPTSPDHNARVVAFVRSIFLDDDLWCVPSHKGGPVIRDLGIAHGLSGLAAALALSIDEGNHDELINDLGSLLLTFIVRQSDAWLMPNYADAEMSRIAWCYGSAGSAAALAILAKRTQRSDLREAAAKLAFDFLEADRRSWQCHDDAVCHGLIGIALCLQSVARANGNLELAAAANSFFSEVAGRFDENMMFGYRAFVPREGWQDDPALLTGGVGIALGLLTGADLCSRAWLKALCLA